MEPRGLGVELNNDWGRPPDELGITREEPPYREEPTEKLSSDMETDFLSDHPPPKVEIEEVRTSNSQPH